MTTKAISPVAGMASKNSQMASSPPAEAPIAAIQKAESPSARIDLSSPDLTSRDCSTASNDEVAGEGVRLVKPVLP